MISAPAMTAARTTAAAALTAMLGLGAGCRVVSVGQVNGIDTGWRPGDSVHLESCGKSEGVQDR
jgi:NaMN:DMB phosphoribosyltransferase